MRKFLAALTTSICLFAAASTSFAATPVTYFFYGFVTAAQQAGPNTPPFGSLVPISITVDASYPADTQRNGVTMYSNFEGSRISPILAATINGKNVHGQFDFVVIKQNANGVYGIEISSGSSQNGGGFDLNLTSSVAGVVKSDKLPRQIFPGNFKHATFSAVLDPLDLFSGAVVE